MIMNDSFHVKTAIFHLVHAFVFISYYITALYNEVYDNTTAMPGSRGMG
jgi:hypothetical protein